MMMKPLPLSVTMVLGFVKLGLQETMPQELYFHPSLDVLDIRSVGTKMEALSALVFETCGSDKRSVLFGQTSHPHLWEFSLRTGGLSCMPLILLGEFFNPLEKVVFNYKTLTIGAHKCFNDLEVSFGGKNERKACWIN